MRVDTLEAYDVPPEVLGIWQSTVGPELLPFVSTKATSELVAISVFARDRSRAESQVPGPQDDVRELLRSLGHLDRHVHLAALWQLQWLEEFEAARLDPTV